MMSVVLSDVVGGLHLFLVVKLKVFSLQAGCGGSACCLQSAASHAEERICSEVLYGVCSRCPHSMPHTYMPLARDRQARHLFEVFLNEARHRLLDLAPLKDESDI